MSDFISQIQTKDGTLYDIKDASVADWARAESKPSYTAAEVGALSADTKIPNVFDWALAATKPAYTATEVGALPSTTKIPNVPAWALNSQKPTYTASEVGALEWRDTRMVDLVTKVNQLLSRVSLLEGQAAPAFIRITSENIGNFIPTGGYTEDDFYIDIQNSGDSNTFIPYKEQHKYWVYGDSTWMENMLRYLADHDVYVKEKQGLSYIYIPMRNDGSHQGTAHYSHSVAPYKHYDISMYYGIQDGMLRNVTEVFNGFYFGGYSWYEHFDDGSAYWKIPYDKTAASSDITTMKTTGDSLPSYSNSFTGDVRDYFVLVNNEYIPVVAKFAAFGQSLSTTKAFCDNNDVYYINYSNI